MSPITSTHEFGLGKLNADSATTALVQGPSWKSFEDFRTAGNSGLEQIPDHAVATLRCKAGTFRILHDADFQRLVGLASDVYRLQNGLKVVIQAARIAAKHPDQEHVQLLIHSASLITERPELPQQQGHLPFDLSPADPMPDASDDFDILNDAIPRPHW